MAIRHTIKLLVLLLLACLGILVTAEKLHFLKTDTLTALMCTGELLSSETDAEQLLIESRQDILAQARRYDLPPEMLAAVIFGHQHDLTPFRKFTDCAGSAMGRNMSLGPAQVRISTAVLTDYENYNTLSHSQYKAFRQRLLEPDQNIQYEAKIIRSLLERSHRYPGITAEEIIMDPFIMSLVMSEYRGGPQDQDSEDSKLSGNAFFDLQHLLEDSVFLFDRNKNEVTRIKDNVRDYLDFIYCESGIFNANTCDSTRGIY